MRLEIIAGTLLLASACGGSVDKSTGAQTSGSGSIAGQYTLSVIADVIGSNAINVPGNFKAQQGYQLDVSSGSLTLRSDFTYQAQVTFHLARNGVTTNPIWTESGTYSLTGQSTLEFTSSTGHENIGTVQAAGSVAVIQTFVDTPAGLLLIPGLEQYAYSLQAAYIKK